MRGGRTGSGLGVRSVALTLGRLCAVLNEAVRRKVVVGIRDDRLYAPLLLSLCRMRLAEVCGLRWSDVDLDAGTLRIANTRALVVGQVLEKTPKSEKGKRLHPLPAPAPPRSARSGLGRRPRISRRAPTTQTAATCSSTRPASRGGPTDRAARPTR